MASKDHRIASIIKSRFLTLNLEQQEIFNEVEDFRQMYRSYMTESDAYPWDYQLVDPQIFPLMRAHLSRLNPQEAKIMLESRTGQDEEIRRVNQQVINWELEEIALTQLFYRCMFSGFIAGKGYLKSGWLFEPAVVIENGKRKVKMREIQNRANLKNVRFTDLFVPNRNVPEIDGQPYLIERISMRFGDMWDMNENTGEEYWKKGLLEKIKKQGIFDGKMEYGVDIPDSDDDNKDEISWRNQYVKLLCMHTIDGDVLYTMENGLEETLNKEQGNEYFHNHYPYIDFTPFPEDDEFFTMGIVQPVADLQIAMSSVLNQLLTTARKQGNPMWIAGTSAAQTPDWQFVNRPDGIIRVVGDVNQIQQIVTQDTSRPLLSLRSEMQTSFERGSSMSSLYTSGASSTPQINKTATGAKIIDQAIDINLQMLISLFGAQVLKRVGEHFLELNAQYMTEDQTFRITGRKGQSEFVTMLPDQVSANFDVRVSPERMLKQSPALRQASLINLFTTLQQAKKDGVPLNLKPVAEAIIDAYPETENIDNINIDPEEKANDVIAEIMRGAPPVDPLYDDDHKAMIAIIQRFLLDNPELPDEKLEEFTEYLEDLQSWIQAKNPQLLQPPAPQAEIPELLPTNEQDLMQSMSQSFMPQANPTASLPARISQDDLGMI